MCAALPSIILSLTEMTQATWAHSATRPGSYAYTYACVNACKSALTCMHWFYTLNGFIEYAVWDHRVHSDCSVNTHTWCRLGILNTQRHTHTHRTFLNVFVGHALNNLPIPLAYSPSSNTHSSLAPTPAPESPFFLPHPSSLHPPCPC